MAEDRIPPEMLPPRNSSRELLKTAQILSRSAKRAASFALLIRAITKTVLPQKTHGSAYANQTSSRNCGTTAIQEATANKLTGRHRRDIRLTCFFLACSPELTAFRFFPRISLRFFAFGQNFT